MNIQASNTQIFIAGQAMPAGTLVKVGPNIQNVPRKQAITRIFAAAYGSKARQYTPFRCSVCGRFASEKTADKFTLKDPLAYGASLVGGILSTTDLCFVHKECQRNKRYWLLISLGILVPRP